MVMPAVLAAVSMVALSPGQRPRRFLALGDSYTIGEGVAEAERWPVQLAAALGAAGVAVDEPTIVARTGWTTPELAAAVDAAPLTAPYDLVTLLVGVNDQYRGGRAAAYRGPFAALLERAIDLAGGDPRRVVVLSIPDWGVTPFAARQGRDPAAVAAAIDRFNAVNREEAAGRGVAYVDVTPLSRRAGDDPTLLTGDGLHPSRRQYAAWVERALPVALSALRTGS